MNAIDWNTLRENCAGDESLVNEVLVLFQGEAGAMLADIGAAVKARDALAIKRTAHRLKGALVSLAAGPATEAARALELAGAAAAVDEAATHYPRLEQEMQRLLQALALPHAA